MSVNLVKGQKVNLSKQRYGLSKLMVGLGWDEVQQKRGLFAPKPQDIDCDAFAILLGYDGHLLNHATKLTECTVFFNNLRWSNGSIQHMGDNLTGAGDGDDEQIKIDLSKIPANITKIAFTVTIYEAEERRQNFGQVSNAFVRIVNEATGQEILRYDLGEDFSIETAVVFGELYKNGNEWKFNAIGSGYQGGLAALCNSYGIAVE